MFISYIVLAFTALLNVSIWYVWNRPVPAPDFDGPVAGLAFSPYQRGQTPENGSGPTAAQIESDLARAATITRSIRTYSVNGGLERIPALANDIGLRVTAGAWLDRRLERNATEIRRLTDVARANSNVERIMVGNEAVLRGDLTVAQLAGYIAQVKRAVRQPVSTAEPWHVWLDHPELAASVDFITVHLLPYWEGLPVDDAIRFTFEKLDAVQAAFPHKPVVIGEIGWPSGGRDIGAARASVVNQAIFMRRFFDIARTRGIDYFVMEAFDQPWKTPFEGRAAGYWGMFDLDRQAKWPLTGPVQERPDWSNWAAIAAMLFLLLAVPMLHHRPDIAVSGKIAFAILTQAFAATLVATIMTMTETYLSALAAAIWTGLIITQFLLLMLLASDAFEMTEAIFGRRWQRIWPARLSPQGARLPKVSIHIPICNEPPEMVRQTLDALARLDYPDFEVLVVDNNTSNPDLWRPVEEHCIRLGTRFRFFHLGKWPGYKAGALNFALSRTAYDAEIIGVLDSDYVVAADWLKRMVPFFSRREVGFVQSPQDYRDGSQSAFKRMMYWEYAGFFHVGMVTRNERNAIIQHGTMTLVRTSALKEVGGWAEWCICEDAELGLRLFRQGWQAVYVAESFGRGVMPDDFAAYRKQRFRWAYGAMQIMRRHATALLSPRATDLSLGQRWHFMMGWLPWIGDALGLLFLLAGLAWSIALILAPTRFEFPIELFMLPSIGLFAFKVVQVLSLYTFCVPNAKPKDRLAAAIAGLALTHTIAKAVLQGLVVRSKPFLRTPKMEDAPALVRGLAMVREELVLLAAIWAAMIGVGVTHMFATLEVKLWCAVLFTQSIPHIAAVVTSIMAALPSARPATLAAPERLGREANLKSGYRAALPQNPPTAP
ncbi:MAG: glycosyltransferase [Alphaproteobacteria bacterium]|nr:glycosyltransferase [Alphaproteobacteria bacterium]